jgi:hypothetical protein
MEGRTELTQRMTKRRRGEWKDSRITDTSTIPMMKKTDEYGSDITVRDRNPLILASLGFGQPNRHTRMGIAETRIIRLNDIIIVQTS